MPSVAPRRRRVALLGVLSLLLPLAPGVAGAAEPASDGSDGTVPAHVVPEPGGDRGASAIRPFLVVAGVDLGALGYGGIPLDADVIDRALAELPADPRQRIAEISTRLDLVPPQLDGLVEAEELLTEALARLESDVSARRGTVALATVVADEADRRVQGARRRVRARATALVAHRDLMAQAAVAAYVRPPGADALDKVLGGTVATTDDLTADVLLTAKSDHDGLVRDELEVAQAMGVERLRAAVADAEGARQRVVTAEAALVEAETRRQAHHDALTTVAGARSSVEEALPALRAEMDRTIEETWGALDALASGPGIDGAAIVSVDGIRIHAAIAPRLQALLVAAHADGVPLGGWGYRSTQQQIELRRSHCGPTPEDIFLKPSSQCSPPTARPGASMHERGLAVDFHLAGRSISTRESPGYRWLAANAAAYGFFNLPSEPWHWSVNGQ